MHPTTRAYCDFLLALTYSGYPAQITAIWALERTYLESWHGAMRTKGSSPCTTRDPVALAPHLSREPLIAAVL